MKWLIAIPALLALLAVPAAAQQYQVESLSQPVPAGSVPDAIATQLSPTGIKVLRGSNRTLCEFWPCKQWTVQADFEPSLQRLYPFRPGQLIGVIRYARRGSDFREQDIDRGFYTLRFALQPVDGNHVGTSPTQDFLLLVQAADETSAEPMEAEALTQASAKAAQSTHPAILLLQQTSEEIEQRPAIRHNEEQDWWTVELVGQAAPADGQPGPLPVAFVIVGHSNE